jgi:predicted PurR-regulated permease PerM
LPDPRPFEHRLILYAVTSFFVGVIALWTLYSIRDALLVIYISGLLAIGFSPSVQWLERQRVIGRTGLPRWGAILLLYFGFLAVVAIVLMAVLPPLITQAIALWHELPGYFDHFRQVLVRYHLFDIRWTMSDLVKSIPAPNGAVTAVFGALQRLIGAIGTIVVILVLPYYLLVEGDSLQSGFLKLFSQERRPWVARLTHDATLKVGAWLSGQLLLSATIGVTTSVGLWLLGVPYFYVLGLIAAAGEFVPIIGPIVAAVPAVLVGFSVSPRTAIFVIIYFSIQQFIEGNILVPRIMQRQVGVSAWMVVVALLLGSELLGVVGAILAVPTAAIVQVVLQEYLEREDTYSVEIKG